MAPRIASARLCTLCVLLLLAVRVAPAAGQPADDAEWEAARAEVEQQTGFPVRWGQNLWLVALRMRSPLVGVWRNGTCEIGLSAWLPGNTTARWLVPPIEGARQRWITGMLHHEAAHCGRARSGALVHASTDGSLLRREEVAADLAFALHLLDDPMHGSALLQHLIALRVAARLQDPLHDTSEALNCLSLGEVPSAATKADRVRYWMERCAADL